MCRPPWCAARLPCAGSVQAERPGMWQEGARGRRRRHHGETQRHHGETMAKPCWPCWPWFSVFGRVWPQSPDFKLQISNFKFQDSKFNLQISTFRLQSSNPTLQISDFKLQYSNFNLFKLQTPDSNPQQTPDLKY